MKLQLPVVRGVIARRLLVNFRVAPELLMPLLPAPFRPKVVRGHGMAGICLIRLEQIRPRFVPAMCGLSSENAAHRIAVEWDEDGIRREGVFIPRRDTSAWFNRWAGGRLFPGEHHAARFRVEEADGRYCVEMESHDDRIRVRVVANRAMALPATSVFSGLAEASRFFERGSLGWSARRQAGVFDGLELRTAAWSVEPLAVEEVESSFFGDARRFPAGTAEFDCALLMRGVAHEWHGRGTMSVPE